MPDSPLSRTGATEERLPPRVSDEAISGSAGGCPEPGEFARIVDSVDAGLADPIRIIQGLELGLAAPNESMGTTSIVRVAPHDLAFGIEA